MNTQYAIRTTYYGRRTLVTTIVISPFNVVNFPEGGGHFWVYLQYAQALRLLGCDVYWLENFRPSGDEAADRSALETFFKRLERYGLGGKAILYTARGQGSGVRGQELETDPRPLVPDPYSYIGL